ncbi:MAG TPA: ABC transporter ATP-binding protein [Pyrinomonadaceae bacterium]|nr:ABC transporter ATP-binding protein [Pyrinomonadaceae bacterium]
MLEAQNISINYGDCEVLQNVSFVLRGGETLAVLGANGAGKTTLLRALNGFLPVSKGEILLAGKPLPGYPRREIARKMSVVAQENETKFPVAVLDFVLAGRFAHGGVFGWESERDLSAAKNALDICDLRNYDARLMNRLSGGERQRVVFARALATEAKILLLDEPTANLDLSHQALMFRLVRDRCKKDKAAAVVVTHDLNLAAEFADTILLLKNGSIAAQGAPEEVLNAETLREVFAVEVLLDENPLSGKRRVTAIY